MDDGLTESHPLRTIPTEAEMKRNSRKKKGPANFRLNKLLVRADDADGVLDIVGTSIRDFNIVNIGTALYRLALVGGNLPPQDRESIRSDTRFGLLVKEIIDTLEGDSEADSLNHVVLAPKELSNIIWASTKLGLNDASLFEAVSKHVIRHMSHFDSVNLSLTLWGFAKMDMPAPEMFRGARGRVIELLPEFEPHRICNTVWAFAKTGNTDPKLFKLIADEAVRKLNRFNHSNESMLLYAFALGGVHAPVLFRKAMAQQLPAIRSGEIQDPRSLSNLLWAISELNLSQEFPDLYATVAHSAISNIHRYSLTHMATVSSAFAKADVRADDLFKLMAQEATSRTVDDESQLSDLLTLQNSFDHFELDSGRLKEFLGEIVEEEHQEIVPNQPESKTKLLVQDLLVTSIIAGVALVVATLVRRIIG
jgi:hypothetical protein